MSIIKIELRKRKKPIKEFVELGNAIEQLKQEILNALYEDFMKIKNLIKRLWTKKRA